ncbi:MAG: hypothetical protein IPM29_31075 [Planctomycetes bacterium]|nr:hypothetical protein [Planctomycetota bacterium]
MAATRRRCDGQPFVERIGYWSGGARLGFLAGNPGRLATPVTTVPVDAGSIDRSALRAGRLAGRAAGSLDPLDPGGVPALRAEAFALRALMRRELEVADLPQARGPARAQLRRDPGDAEPWLVAGAGDGGPTSAALDGALALDPTRVDRPSRIRDAIRAAFAVRCAFALCGVAAARPLERVAATVLAPLLDPASFDALSESVRARRGDPAAEPLPVERRDLEPSPTV